MRLGAIVIVFLTAAPAAAQSAAEPARFEIGPYFGVARHSPVGTHLGVTPDRDHVFVGVHAFAPLWSSHRVTLGFAPDAVPLLVVTNNPVYVTVTTPDGERFRVDSGERGPVVGFAVAPIGFEGRLAFSRGWQGFMASSVGCVWFTREVPILEARRLNYTLEVGGGLQWRYRPRTALRLGYKFHHLSNFYTALANPGIDGAVFLVGVQQAIGSR